MELTTDVPLETALDIAGRGRYSYLMMVLAGLVDFAAFSGIQLMSVVIPAAGCDLHLTTYQKGVLTSMVYAGMIFSSHLWGFLADAYGRRRVMLHCALGSVLVQLLSSLAPTAAVLMAACFVSGLLLAGIFTPIYVYIGECCCQDLRSRALLIVCAISSLATVYLPAVGWVVLPLEMGLPLFGEVRLTSWRLYIALAAGPFLWSFVCLLALPETPKFLLSKGHQPETMKVLRKLYARNHNKPEEDYPVMSVRLDSSDATDEIEEDKSRPFLQFFKTIFIQTKIILTPPFLKYTAISCLLCVGVFGVFSTILLWFPEMVNRLMYYANSRGPSARLCEVMADGGSAEAGEDDPCHIKDQVFIINISNGLLQSLCYYVFSFIAPRFTSKRILVALAGLTTVSCGVVVLASNVYVILAAQAGMVIFLLVAFPVFISVIVDFFPTSLRTNATSIILLCGRISSVAGSQIIGALYDSYCEAAFPGITAALICMTILFMMLPVKLAA